MLAAPYEGRDGGAAAYLVRCGQVVAAAVHTAGLLRRTDDTVQSLVLLLLLLMGEKSGWGRVDTAPAPSPALQSAARHLTSRGRAKV